MSPMRIKASTRPAACEARIAPAVCLDFADVHMGGASAPKASGTAAVFDTHGAEWAITGHLSAGGSSGPFTCRIGWSVEESFGEYRRYRMWKI